MISDHDQILLHLDLSKNIKFSTSSRTNFKTNDDSLYNDLANTNFECVYAEPDANKAASYLVDIINTAVTTNSCVVKVPRSKHILKEWLTPGVIKSIRTRDRLHLKLKKNSNNTVAELKYKKYRNLCNYLIKCLKREYHRTELAKNNSNNPKKLWNTVKNICYLNKRSTEALPLLSIEDTRWKSINCVNEFFSSVGKKLANKIISNKNIDMSWRGAY